MNMRVLPLLLLLASCSSKIEQKGPLAKPVPVIAVPSSVADVPLYIDSVGKLSPSAFVELFPQVNGTLQEVLVKEGDRVEKGSPLFKIDETLYLIKVEEAEAQLASDLATLKSVEGKLERYKQLSTRELITKNEWDDLLMQQRRAESLTLLDMARLTAAKLDLDSCLVKAPISGRVGKIDVTPGVHLKSSNVKPLVTIADVSTLSVEFSVTEKEFSRLEGVPTALVVESMIGGNGQAVGSVTYIDDHFDQKSGQLLVKGVVGNSEGLLRPGQSIRVKLPISTVVSAKLIPQKAVRYNEQGPFVYTVNGDQMVEFHQVTLGEELGSQVIVQEGLSQDDLVITEGHLRLYPGLKVDVRS